MRKLRLIGLLMCVVIAFSAGACGKSPVKDDTSDPSKQQEDLTKTQLYVNNYNGGFGGEWLNKAIIDFQEKYKDFEFEVGKKGIQIWPGTGKQSGKGLLSQMKFLEDHIFITESVFYRDYVSEGAMLDITDVVTEKLTDFGEEKTIESKFLPEQKEFLNVGTASEPKYYAIPHYFGTNGIAYDVELFDQYRLYFDKDGKMTKRSTDTGLSAGGDGVEGTFDDGLPATYSQFFELCDKLKNKLGVTPLIWSGQYLFYTNYFLSMLAAEANGKAGHMLTQTLSGISDRNVASYDNNGITTDSVTIDRANRYKVYNQAGYYYALKFIKQLVDGNYYDENSFINGFSHTDTQDMFIMSGREPSIDRIAMIIEGNWWENEAESTFKAMENTYSDAGRNDRKFGFMPLPKPNADYVGEKHALVECNTAYMFINSQISDEMKLAAKLFIKYINTDEKLREFSVITNTPKSLKVDLTDDDLAKMSYYGKSVNEFKNSPYTETIYQCSTDPVYLSNMGTTFSLDAVFTWGVDYTYPAKSFFDNRNLSVSDYYSGYIRNWENKFSKL